jgi:hypothetical protein
MGVKLKPARDAYFLALQQFFARVNSETAWIKGLEEENVAQCLKLRCPV